MTEQTLWFIFIGGELLLEQHADETFSVPEGNEPPLTLPSETTIHTVTAMDDGREVRTLSLPETSRQEPAQHRSWKLCPLRKSYYKLKPELYRKAGKCWEIVYWDSHNKYCGVCGHPLTPQTDISKTCKHCGNEVWAQVVPAVIVRINRGDELLLVRARNFRSHFFGLVAGFVETGEKLEEAVMREVKEETGIAIKNLRYFDSQPWPFPCGMMVGFTAEYASGELHLQSSELAEGGWFDYRNLPTLPEKLSIARMLIDDFTAHREQH